MSSSQHVTVHTLTWRRQLAVLLLLLGSVLSIATAFMFLKAASASAEPTLYAVEGKVLVGDQPAENVNVAFHSLDRDKNQLCPVGRTNNRGIFHLTTRSDADGAPAGEYRVTLVWPDGLIDECEIVDPKLHDRLEGSYAQADESTLKVTVNPSSNSFWFNAKRQSIDRAEDGPKNRTERRLSELPH